MARLALVTTYEALEMAGYAPNRTPSTRLKRVGTFFGQASDDWRELNGSQNISTYAVPGGERAFAMVVLIISSSLQGPVSTLTLLVLVGWLLYRLHALLCGPVKPILSSLVV